MKSTVTFKYFFNKFIAEDSTTGALISSDSVADIYDPNSPISGDKYNQNDARIAKGGKIIQTRKGKIHTSKKRKK